MDTSDTPPNQTVQRLTFTVRRNRARTHDYEGPDDADVGWRASFAEAWAELQSQDEAELPYVCISRFIGHLRELHQAGDVSAFSKVAGVIERFHMEGAK